jgi:D-aminopeptidase
MERLANDEVLERFVLDMPIRLTVEFFSSDMADRAALVPYTERAGARLSFEAPEMTAAYRAFRAMVALAVG